MLKQNCKKVYSRTTTKSIPLLQPEHGFCQKNGPKCGQVKIGFEMKKWWWLSFVCLVDVILQGMWVLYRINKGEDNETLSRLVFRRDVANTFFSEIFKGKQIILEPCKDSKYPMRCLL